MTPTITIKQPWAQLIVAGHKTIETRTHSRFGGLQGQRIYIHAGRGYDPTGTDIATRYLTADQLSTLTTGAIIATAYVSEARELTEQDEANALIECQTPRYGLVLSDITPIEPIPAKGKQGVWYLPEAA
jgi:hypothetical protein